MFRPKRWVLTMVADKAGLNTITENPFNVEQVSARDFAINKYLPQIRSMLHCAMSAAVKKCDRLDVVGFYCTRLAHGLLSCGSNFPFSTLAANVLDITTAVNIEYSLTYMLCHAICRQPFPLYDHPGFAVFGAMQPRTTLPTVFHAYNAC